jgi:hypothetical protein
LEGLGNREDRPVNDARHRNADSIGFCGIEM